MFSVNDSTVTPKYVSKRRYKFVFLIVLSCMFLLKGEVTITVMSGTLALVVKEGDILVNIHKISQDSFIDMETGNIVLNVPTGKLPFR